MEIKTLTLNKEWDGIGYVVLHQSLGFNFDSSRFSQGLVLSDMAILFNDEIDVDKDMILAIEQLIKQKLKQSPSNNKKELTEN